MKISVADRYMRRGDKVRVSVYIEGFQKTRNVNGDEYNRTSAEVKLQVEGKRLVVRSFAVLPLYPLPGGLRLTKEVIEAAINNSDVSERIMNKIGTPSKLIRVDVLKRWRIGPGLPEGYGEKLDVLDEAGNVYEVYAAEVAEGDGPHGREYHILDLIPPKGERG